MFTGRLPRALISLRFCALPATCCACQLNWCKRVSAEPSWVEPCSFWSRDVHGKEEVLVANLHCCKYEVLHKAVVNCGYTIQAENETDDNWDLCWSDLSVSPCNCRFAACICMGNAEAGYGAGLLVFPALELSVSVLYTEPCVLLCILLRNYQDLAESGNDVQFLPDLGPVTHAKGPAGLHFIHECLLHLTQLRV
eukprot:scaffold209175_cov19-Tisochrysis_lutea.AAC.1